MSVSIKVAVRCRPFTIDDDLGVRLTQNGEEAGEINILNSTYSTTRFAFTYAWWSAFGFDRHVNKDTRTSTTAAEEMELIDQQKVRGRVAENSSSSTSSKAEALRRSLRVRNDHAAKRGPTMDAVLLTGPFNWHKVYSSVGKRIKADLLTGNAVVMFAYGLSGSGKTFTVFGPDAVDEPEAWFKHGNPHPLWGIFPRLAYELFQEKKDGWKITMKYFQNVVDTVRDLMSPVGNEMHYKSGMKKDPDGFTDIEWCSSAVLDSWNDLRNAFKAANARKAIAPTQFNHQSTRGHCILTLEVQMPHPDMDGMKQRGRVYVCDLAGTEPAGDIVYACYEKKTLEGGDMEYKYVGPHQDTRKTKELQDQGKKINLSLSEMAQFFMKMAEAVRSGTLKPGHSIPGCNSYFLCKYLKDTMLQARTYLFCAIRPEVTYHKYTFSTLGFAKNASVVKLKPKKATVQVTAAEKKLMEELEQMKSLVEQLRQQQVKLVAAATPETPAAGSTTAPSATPLATSPTSPTTSAGTRQEKPAQGEPGVETPEASKDKKDLRLGASEESESRQRRQSIVKNAEQVSRLQEMLEAKQLQLREVLSGGGGDEKGPTPEERQLLQQREEYGRRGISLSHFEADTRLPHLVNVDEDPFRHNRFVYLLKKRLTVFGPQCDVQPMSLSVQRKHCSVEVKKGEAGAMGTVTLIGGRGDVWHNGKRVRKQEQVILLPYDRVAIGTELLLFRWKALQTRDTGPPPTAEEATTEFRQALQVRSGRRHSAELHAMEEQLKNLQVAKAKAEEEAKNAAADRAASREKDQGIDHWITPFHAEPLDDEHIASVIRSAEGEVQMLLPHVKEVEQIMQLFGRAYLKFDVSLQRSQGDVFEVAASVRVKNERTGQSCYVSSFEFLEQRSIFQAEVTQLQAALDNGREYSVPAEHDPSLRLMQDTHELGVATLFTEPIVYMMVTEDEESISVIKDVRAPYGEVGKLESSWYPLVVGDDGQLVDIYGDEDCVVDLPEIDNPTDLVGMPWAYRFEIKMASGLPLTCASAYCQYDLLGETFTTETVQPDPPSASPVFNYSLVHKVDKVTRDIVERLSKPLNVYLYVAPHVEPEKPEDEISTNNPGVVARFESLCRPKTPTVPAASPLPSTNTSGRAINKNRSKAFQAHEAHGAHQEENAEVSGGDAGPISSWGFALPDVSPTIGGAIDVGGASFKGEGMTALSSKLSMLQNENASLKRELRQARAEIKRLTVEGGGVATAVTSASTGALGDKTPRGGRGGFDGDCAGGGSPTDTGGRLDDADDLEYLRESKSRKKIDIDTARATDDAVVEAIRQPRECP